MINVYFSTTIWYNIGYNELNGEAKVRNERQRLIIIDFLQWNDRNGCYTDENCDLEEIPRMTYEDAIKYFFYVVNEDFFSEKIEDIAEVEYEEMIQYSKENGFYDSTMNKLSRLVKENNLTVELYKELI